MSHAEDIARAQADLKRSGFYRGEHEQWAAKALEYLQLARTAAKNAKATRTLQRIDHAISSARGAVRAGMYRDIRQAESERN